MLLKMLDEELHIVRPTYYDDIVIPGTLSEKITQGASATAEHELRIYRKAGVDLVPRRLGLANGIVRDEAPTVMERLKDTAGARKSRTVGREWHEVVDYQQARPPTIGYASKQNRAAGR